VGTFEYFDHAADVGIEVEASSLPDLFVTAARGLMEWMGPAPDSPPTRTESVAVQAENLDELRVRWLQELLYLFHRCRCYWLCVSVVEVTDRTVSATISGSPWKEASGYQEVKAVTYHQVQVLKRSDIWHARVILDI
jgi:SHS2 domain-containing protein